jgi:chromosome segregation ATPase
MSDITSMEAPSNGSDKTSRIGLIVLAVLMALGVGGLFLYSKNLNAQLTTMNRSLEASLNRHGESLQQIAQRLDQTDMRHAELAAEYTVTKERVGMTQSELQRARQIAADLVRQQKESADQLAGQLGQLQQEQAATKGNLGTLSTDVTGVRSEVKTTQAELQATRSELQRVIGDMGVQSDLIARNAAELVDLRARGDRDYVEFDLRKAAKRQRVGNLQLELKKTDEKRQKYTINLIADDRTIEKKDKTVFEPVQFYRVGDRQATEIVIQQVFKDRIVGYISAPKRSEAATASASAS